MRMVRRLRHWKQRFNPNAEFIWRRPVTWDGEQVQPGDPIPDSLKANRAKLRRFWEAKVIELAEFEAPNVATGRVQESTEDNGGQGQGDSSSGDAESVEALVSKESDRKWKVEGTDETFATKKAALEAAASLVLLQALGTDEQPEGEESEGGESEDGESEDETDPLES